MITTKSIAALTLLLAVGLSTAAFAQDKIDAGQTPPIEAPQEPKAESKPEPVKCVTDDAKFWHDNGKYTFRVELKNSCAQRQRCTINVYIVNAAGPVKGTGTLMLPAAAPGQYSQKMYALKLKQDGGMANESFSCKAI